MKKENIINLTINSIRNFRYTPGWNRARNQLYLPYPTLCEIPLIVIIEPQIHLFFTRTTEITKPDFTKFTIYEQGRCHLSASFLDKHFKNTSASFPRKLSHETTEGAKRLLYIIKENAKYQTNTTDETKVTNNNINLLVPDTINQTDKKHILVPYTTNQTEQTKHTPNK